MVRSGVEPRDHRCQDPLRAASEAPAAAVVGEAVNHHHGGRSGAPPGPRAGLVLGGATHRTPLSGAAGAANRNPAQPALVGRRRRSARGGTCVLARVTNSAGQIISRLIRVEEQKRVGPRRAAAACAAQFDAEPTRCRLGRSAPAGNAMPGGVRTQEYRANTLLELKTSV